MTYKNEVIALHHHTLAICNQEQVQRMILSILVYTLFSRMFDLMQPPVVKHSIAVA